MRDKLKKRYEKNPKTINSSYAFLKTCFIVFGKYKTFKEEINEAINTFEEDITKAERKKMFKKLLVYRYIYYLRPSEYYLYNFEKASYDKRKTFMTRQLTNRYYRVINEKKFRKVLDKKNLSYKVFKDYYKRDLICVNSEDEKEKFLKFIKGKDKFILKPFSGHSGDGIEIISVDKFVSDDELFNYTMDKAPFVAEELIKQSEGLGCFHENSVNTIRVVTFQYKEDASILWTFLRTGQGGYSVDNMGAAGLGALIDEKTGKVISDGVNWKGDKEKCHPDSKIEFKGFQIPRWDEALETAKKLASELSEMHCVGWDLALTDDGWVLVEGNARPQCVTIQTFTKNGYKPYYDKMYKLVKKQKDEEMEENY